MLSAEAKQTIRDLAAAGMKQCAIARRFKISDAYVSKIVSRHPDVDRVKKREDECLPRITISSPDRCPGCGQLVCVWPCLDCCNSSR